MSKLGKQLTRERAAGLSQAKLFEKVWTVRSHFCCVSGKYIPEAHAYCFAHCFPKGMYPNLKFVFKNIFMVASIEDHEKFDRIVARHKNNFADYLDGIIEIDELCFIAGLDGRQWGVDSRYLPI